MATSSKFFREYLILRSKAIVYVAVGIAILALFALGILVGADRTNINRFGLLLQLIGVLVLVPDVFGKDTLRRLWQGRSQPKKDGLPLPVTGNTTAVQQEPDMEGFALFEFYRKNNMPLLLGNILISLGLFWVLFSYILFPTPEFFPGEINFRILLALMGFAWLNLFMLILLSHQIRPDVPGGLLAGFFIVDFFVSIPGIFIAGIVYILINWVTRGIGFLFANGVRRVLLIVTLPCFIVGLTFELLATFFP